MPLRKGGLRDVNINSMGVHLFMGVYSNIGNILVKIILGGMGVGGGCTTKVSHIFQNP